MKPIDFRIFRTNWIPDFLPIGSLWLETSATALCGPYVINLYNLCKLLIQKNDLGQESIFLPWAEVCFVLVTVGILPLMGSHSGLPTSIWCSAMSFVTFILVFLFSSDVLGILGLRGYRTFLDKVCVDQSDEEKKRQGIGAITAFLWPSDRGGQINPLKRQPGQRLWWFCDNPLKQLLYVLHFRLWCSHLFHKFYILRRHQQKLPCFSKKELPKRYHSDAMVVLYSELYLTRLWTVYELTTFLALQPDAQILVQPVILGPVAVSCYATFARNEKHFEEVNQINHTACYLYLYYILLLVLLIIFVHTLNLHIYIQYIICDILT